MSRTRIDNPVYNARPYSYATEEECQDPKYRTASFRNIRAKPDGRRLMVVGEWPKHKIITFWRAND